MKQNHKYAIIFTMNELKDYHALQHDEFSVSKKSPLYLAGKDLVFQTVTSNQNSETVLSFQMISSSYHRRRLRNMVRFIF